MDLIGDGGESSARGTRALALSSEFCTVQVLEGPKKLSALQNSEVSTFGSNLKSCINGASIRRVSSGLISKVAAFGSVR